MSSEAPSTAAFCEICGGLSYGKSFCPTHQKERNILAESKNPDGTFNGIKALAVMSGLDEAEIAWMADRMRFLIHTQGKNKSEAKSIVTNEARAKPWLKKEQT